MPNVERDLKDPDVFVEEYLKRKGLPQQSEVTEIEKECQCTAEIARNEYKKWSAEMDRMQGISKVNISTLPDNMKYSYRLFRNKKSADASKVYKTAYQHLLAKRVLEMEALLASSNIPTEDARTRNDLATSEPKKEPVDHGADVKFEVETYPDTSSNGKNQRVMVKFNEKEERVRFSGLNESEAQALQLFASNQEDAPKGMKLDIVITEGTISDGNVTGSRDDVAVNVYHNNLGSSTESGVELNHIGRQGFSDIGSASGAIGVRKYHEERGPPVLTRERDECAVHVECRHDQSKKNDGPCYGYGYSTDGSTIQQLTHLHRCNETFAKLFNSNVEGRESGDNGSLFREVMNEALAEECSNIEISQPVKLE